MRTGTTPTLDEADKATLIALVKKAHAAMGFVYILSSGMQLLTKEQEQAGRDFFDKTYWELNDAVNPQ